jgi:aspartate/methionine/tyrosine aminotransferase
MNIRAFETERYFAKYEFTTPHLLSVSDCESFSIDELLQFGGYSIDDLTKIRLGYTESQGDPLLRARVADNYENVDADHVLILNSPVEGIYLAMRSLLALGDEAIILSPAYDALINLAESISSQVIRWQINSTTVGWQLDLKKLQTIISEKTKLIVVNFPHNPSGLLPSEEEFSRLVELADKYGIWLFCDEMYRGLEFSQRSTLPSAADLYQRSIVLAGLSKSHGLPGLRAGWLIVRDAELRQQIINWKDYTSICPAAPIEFLARVALDAGEKLVQRNNKIISDNIRLANAFFARWADMFTWRVPEAGSVALVGISVSSATRYCHQLAKEAGILLLPAKFMGYDDRHVRFGFGRLSFPAALAAYEKNLEQNSNKPAISKKR